jgi:hypothetical protein
MFAAVPATISAEFVVKFSEYPITLFIDIIMNTFDQVFAFGQFGRWDHG